MGPTWYQLKDGGKLPQPGPYHSNIGCFLLRQSELQQLILDTTFEVIESTITRSLSGTSSRAMAGVLEDPSCAQHVCVANPIVADFDAGGQQEVAFTRWYDLWLLDLETGNLDRNVGTNPASREWKSLQVILVGITCSLTSDLKSLCYLILSCIWILSAGIKTID